MPNADVGRPSWTKGGIHSRCLCMKTGNGAEPDLARLVPWLEARLQEPLTVPMMAEARGMSDRSFQRRCSLQFGLAPGRLLSELRLERAKALLSDPKAQLAAVVLQSGFADASALSKAFRKRFGSAPANHRNRFRL